MSTRKEKPIGYVASPYGFAESTRGFYYDTLLPLVKRHITVIDPWAEDVSPILAAKPKDQPSMWLDLGETHLNNIATRAKIVVASLDQEPPDSGTVIEIAWVAAHGIPIIGYRNDLRTSGEDGLPYNLMIGAAIRRSGGIAVASLVELEKELSHRVPNLTV